eukprot:14048483-Ditylum_brightwellii.AAC.1
MRLKNLDGDLAVVIKNIKHCKEMKLSFKQMKPITKGVTGEVVSKIHVLNPTSILSPAVYNSVIHSLAFEKLETYTVLDDQDMVMSRLVARNKLHLHQAFDTPFAQEDMLRYIGKLGTGQGVEDILNADYNPSKFSNLLAVNYWVKQNIWQVATVGTIDISMETDELQKLLKKQHETTSYSPSERHYGHYKVLID